MCGSCGGSSMLGGIDSGSGWADKLSKTLDIPRVPDPLVDVTCSYEEQVIEVHTTGQMIELSVEDAEALGHKLLAIAQDCREAQKGVVHP
jgi:hypothetical protein